MLALNPQYIVDDNETKTAVVVGINEWEKIIEQLEVLDDIQTYDNAIKNPSQAISFDEVVKNIRNK